VAIGHYLLAPAVHHRQTTLTYDQAGCEIPISLDARRFVILATSNVAFAGMSIRAMNWAWDVLLPPTAKLVLLALADIADDAGSCWPSQNVIAAKCSVTSRTCSASS
jgi:hypothetical protein